VIEAYRTSDDRRWYRLSLGLTIGAAWASLAAWGVSPYAGLLDHGGPGVPGLAPVQRAGLFVVGWTLMTVAMMLPSSLPLVNLFRRFVLHRPDRARLLGLLLVGYLGVWAIFGLLAYAADGLIHRAVAWLPGADNTSAVIGGGLLLAAGVYQFTPLKATCLEKCRSPYMFLVQNWRGRDAGRDALRLGVRHGLFCLGCCWSLMLVMFGIGGANLGWMLAPGALTAAERTTRIGRRLTRPVGIVLSVCGALILAGGISFPGR
jgi:predicted metal-binding membrane protein